VSDESDADRERRLAQRVLFDSVAELYQVSRRGYADELVDWVLATAGVGADDPVLEIGCGTGQLTRSLALRGVDLTAVDIGPSMIETARRHVEDPSVRFAIGAFEDFEAPDASFALVASATAIHWVDPGVRWTKPARLLRPGGWLAVFATGERYDEPLGSSLRELWISLSEDKSWATRPPPSLPDELIATGRYGPAVERQHESALTLPREMIVGVESTRATTLHYDQARRARFLDGLHEMIGEADEIGLVQRTSVTMAPVFA
jgi:ubiquinone/menaquinone biosynthesis C-methylase UbiE